MVSTIIEKMILVVMFERYCSSKYGLGGLSFMQSDEFSVLKVMIGELTVACRDAQVSYFTVHELAEHVVNKMRGEING